MRIHCLQHVSHEPAGRIATWAGANGHEFTVTRLFDQEPLPEVSSLDALVVMGGPMGVHDEAVHPWMRGEKHLVSAAIDAEKPVLGVCLGAQMIAHVSGARVYRNRFHEIGWFPVEATDEGTSRLGLPRLFQAFHWHGDTFALPAGAVHLARTDACEQQMFAMDGRILGIQFHLEVTPDEIAGMLAGVGDELPEGPYVQRPEALEKSADACEHSNRLLDDVLARWMGDGVS